MSTNPSITTVVPEAYISATDDTFTSRLASFDNDYAPFTDLHLLCTDGIVKGHSLLFSAHSPVIHKLLTESMHSYHRLTSPSVATPSSSSSSSSTDTVSSSSSSFFSPSSSSSSSSTETVTATASSSSVNSSPSISSSPVNPSGVPIINQQNGLVTYTIDVRPATCTQLRYIRTFVYTGKVKLPAYDAGLLITAAARLQMDHLKSSIEAEVVARFIDAGTACAYLLVGRTPNATSAAVEGAAREYIRRNTAACFASDSFFDLDIDSLISLLKDDELSIREDDLFRYCLSWADVRSATEETKPSRILTTVLATNNISNEVSTTTSAMFVVPPVTKDIFNPVNPSASSHALWNKSDPQLSRKLIRENLLKLILPYIRFPIMGAQSFARTVVPTDALPTEDVSALLLYFMAPDVPNAAIRFSTKPRKGSGSVFTWSIASAVTNSTTVSFHGKPEDNKVEDTSCEDTKYRNKYVTLSGDRRTANFQCHPKDPLSSSETMLVTEQSFAGGIATVYITTWGLDSVTVGLLKSDNDNDDGDCAIMMVEHALSDSLRFEGIQLRSLGTINDELKNETTINKDDSTASLTKQSTFESITRTSFFAPYQPRFTSSLVDTSVATESNHKDSLCLRDGSCLILHIDWDVHRATFSIHHKSSPKPIEIGTLNNLPIKPFRVSVGAVSRSSGGDIDGIVTINNKLPSYLLK